MHVLVDGDDDEIFVEDVDALRPPLHSRVALLRRSQLVVVFDGIQPVSAVKRIMFK